MTIQDMIKNKITKKSVFFVFIGFLLAAQTGFAQWTQWGGPNRDFAVKSDPLRTDWDEKGPKELWNHEFGDGYSTILYEDGILYTTKRKGEMDAVVALKASTGETIWETTYDAPMIEGMILDFGHGPVTSPLLVGDRLYTISLTVIMNCLDKKTGKILWTKDLMNEMKASHLGRGYGPSPLAYKNMVIVDVGGADQAVVAFDQETGEVVWKSQSFRNGYSSPILVNIDGEDQLIVAMGSDRAGLDPNTGELKWHLALPQTAGTLFTTQNWGEDNLLFASQAYADGSRVLEITKKDGKFEAKELWYNRKMRVMYGTYARIGDYIYASSGGFGPAFLMCLNVKTGKIMWRKRGFSRAHIINANGTLIILDEDGNLAIATPSPEELTILSKAKVLDRTAWTAPTLVGSKLFIRNRTHIKAFELGK